MKLVLKLSLIAALLLIPTASMAGTSHFLENYDQLRPGKYVEKYYFDNQALHEKAYTSIGLKEIVTCYLKGSWGLKPERAAALLKGNLRESAIRAQIGQYFNFESAEHAKAILEIGITQQSTGSPIGRMTVFPLGWGQAYVRIEGRLKDADTGKVIAAFTHFKSSKALWILEDFNLDSGIGMLKVLYKEMANDIMKEIGNSFGLIPETLKDDIPFKYS